MDKRANVKSIVYGALGGFVGIVPVSFLKTGAVLSNYSLWVALNYLSYDHPIALTVLGVLYNIFLFDVFSFLVYLIIAFIGSAVFGYWGAQLSMIRLRKMGDDIEQRAWRFNGWWSFLFGLIFDLIFVFIWLYPGQ